jgi:hypothetical protein
MGSIIGDPWNGRPMMVGKHARTPKTPAFFELCWGGRRHQRVLRFEYNLNLTFHSIPPQPPHNRAPAPRRPAD